VANGYENNIPAGRPAALGSLGTTITAGGSPHALSASFTDLIASTAFNATRLRILITNSAASGAVTNALLNIYFGAAASEVLQASLLAGWATAQDGEGGGKVYDFPLYIPSGTRISAKSQALVASQTMKVIVELWEEGKAAGTAIESLGVSAAASTGTAVTPGTASEGSFATIGTTVNAWNWAFPGMDGNVDLSVLGNAFAADIGTGSSPITGLTDFLYSESSAEEFSWYLLGRHCSISASTALQLRLQASATDTENKQMALYGVYGTPPATGGPKMVGRGGLAG